MFGRWVVAPFLTLPPLKMLPHCASKFKLHTLKTSSSTTWLRIYYVPVTKGCGLSLFQTAKEKTYSVFHLNLADFSSLRVWWSVLYNKPPKMRHRDCGLFFSRLFIMTNSWLCSKLVCYTSFMIWFFRLWGQVRLPHSRKTILRCSPPNYLRRIFISLK